MLQCAWIKLSQQLHCEGGQNAAGGTTRRQQYFEFTVGQMYRWQFIDAIMLKVHGCQQTAIGRLVSDNVLRQTAGAK